jgi:hypothetical protein
MAVNNPPLEPPSAPPVTVGLGKVATVAGYVLAITYPLFALSIGVRAIYQLCCRPDIPNRLGPWLSLVAAVIYAVAAVGFARRSRRAWTISLSALSFELVCVLVVGTVTTLDPTAIPHTAWGRFGQDYGFFLVFQPFLGLLWLLWPTTREAYGITRRTTGT